MISPVTKMDSTPWRPRAVLANEVYEDISLGNFSDLSLESVCTFLVPGT